MHDKVIALAREVETDTGINFSTALRTISHAVMALSREFDAHELTHRQYPSGDSVRIGCVFCKGEIWWSNGTV